MRKYRLLLTLIFLASAGVSNLAYCYDEYRPETNISGYVAVLKEHVFNGGQVLENQWWPLDSSSFFPIPGDYVAESGEHYAQFCFRHTATSYNPWNMDDIGVLDLDQKYSSETDYTMVADAPSSSWILWQKHDSGDTNKAEGSSSTFSIPAGLHAGNYCIELKANDEQGHNNDLDFTSNYYLAITNYKGPSPTANLYLNTNTNSTYPVNKDKSLVMVPYSDTDERAVQVGFLDWDTVLPNVDDPNTDEGDYLSDNVAAEVTLCPDGWSVTYSKDGQDHNLYPVPANSEKVYFNSPTSTGLRFADINIPAKTKPGRYTVTFHTEHDHSTLQSVTNAETGEKQTISIFTVPLETGDTTLTIDIIQRDPVPMDAVNKTGCGCSGNGVIVDGISGTPVNLYDTRGVSQPGTLCGAPDGTGYFLGENAKHFPIKWTDSGAGTGHWGLDEPNCPYTGMQGPVDSSYNADDEELSITMGDGSIYTYKLKKPQEKTKAGDPPQELPPFPTAYPIRIEDPHGRVTTIVPYGMGQIESITDPNNLTITYNYAELEPNEKAKLIKPLVGITTPDGQERVKLDYISSNPDPYIGVGFDLLSKYRIVDPFSSGEEYNIEYKYGGKAESEYVALPSSIDSISVCDKPIVKYLYYDDGKVKYEQVVDDPSTISDPDIPKVYSLTGFTNGGSTIRHFRDTGSFEYPTSFESSNLEDIIEQRSHTLSGNVITSSSATQKWYESGTEHTATSSQTYNQYGSLTDSSDPYGGSVHINYYEPDQLYPVDTATQYNVTDRNSVQYSGTEGTYLVQGNGLPSSITVWQNSDVVYSAQFRYYVKQDGSKNAMTPYVTISKGPNGLLTKNILNTGSKATFGTVQQTWVDTGQNGTDGKPAFQLIKSYDYYTSEDNNKGRLHTATTYNVASDESLSSDLRKNVITYDYSNNGRTITATTNEGTDANPSYVSSTVSYNSLGQLVSVSDSGHTTNYEYDYRGRLVKTTVPAIASKSISGNGVEVVGDTSKTIESVFIGCNLQNITNENGISLNYDYDKDGRQTKAWFSGISGQSSSTPLIEYGYDDAYFGRLGGVTTRVKKPDNSIAERTTSYMYDEKYRVVGVLYPPGVGSAGPSYNEYYQYDDADRVVAKLVGRVVGGKVTAGKITVYGYYSNGRLYQVEYDHAYTPDSTGWPLSPSDLTIIDVNAIKYTYGASLPYLVTKVEGVVNGVSVGASYGYDSRGNLTSYTPDLPANYGSITYTYDILGRKTSMTVPLGLASSVQANARKVNYAYDKNGNLCSTTVTPAHIDGATSTSLTETADTGKSHFYFDDNGNRVKLTNKAGEVYYFVYDPTASVPAVVYEQGPANRYLNIREPDGSLITRETYDSSGSITMSRTYHYDGLGSTVALSDENGNVTDTYQYDAWGNVTSHTGPGALTTDNPYQYVGQLGYYTHYQEADYKLLSLGVRFYDPANGRFSQQDPIGDGISWYAYGNNNPAGYVDPSGLKPTGFEAAQMAADIYNDKCGNNLSGGWVREKSLTGGDDMVMGVYRRDKLYGSEYALVNKGTTPYPWTGAFWNDWKNNFQQPFGNSDDISSSMLEAQKFVNSHPLTEITMIGHSKGGAEAMANALRTNKNCIVFNPAAVFLEPNGLSTSKYTASMMIFIVDGEILDMVSHRYRPKVGKEVRLEQQYGKDVHANSWFEFIMNGIKNHSMQAVLKALRWGGYR